MLCKNAVSFLKVGGLQLATFLQTVSVTGYVRVPVNVAKFYVIAVLKNTSEWLLLTSEWRKNMIR